MSTAARTASDHDLAIEVVCEMLAYDLPWEVELWSTTDEGVADPLDRAVRDTADLARDSGEALKRSVHSSGLAPALKDLRERVMLLREPLEAELEFPDTWSRHKLETLARPAQLFLAGLANAIYRARVIVNG